MDKWTKWIDKGTINDLSHHLLSKRNLLKLKTKLCRMSSDEIKRYFKESLNDSLLYGIPKYHKTALTIYMLSDDSLKKELDAISIEVQGKKIDTNEKIMNTLAMGHLGVGLMAQVNKETSEENHEKEAK